MNKAPSKLVKPLIRHSLWMGLFFLVSMPAMAYQDQIAMTSDNQIKTVFDVKAYALLRNLYQNDTLIDPEDSAWQKAHLLAERDGYLEQLLVEKYIQDNRVKLKMQDEPWEDQAIKLYDRWMQEKNQHPKVEQWGISKNQVFDWMKNRHMLETFLLTHRPFQAIVTSHKIDQYYEENKSNQFLDKPLEGIRGLVEADFKQNFLKQEFQRWVTQELRRQKWKLYAMEPST